MTFDLTATHTEVLVRQNQIEQDDAGAPAWHLAYPAYGEPILAEDDEHFEFATRDEAIAFLEAKGITPVFDRAEAFPAGTRVEGGEGDDYDIGTVSTPNEHDERIPHMPTDVWVAWDSGASTWTPIDIISAA